MIKLNHPAYAHCDAAGCNAAQPVSLVLMESGGFGAVPQSATWQLLRAPNGVLLARCPEHIEQPGADPSPPRGDTPDASLPPESMT